MFAEEGEKKKKKKKKKTLKVEPSGVLAVMQQDQCCQQYQDIASIPSLAQWVKVSGVAVS